MSDELGKALLGKDGLQAGQIDAMELEKLRQKVAKSRKRIRRLRWVIAISWAWAAVYVVVFRVFMLSATGSGVAYPPPALRPWQLAILWLAGLGFFMIPVAVVSTVSYFVRSRELGMAEIRFQLARLEELLRKDGLQAGQIDAMELEELRQKVALDQKRVRRLRWILTISWAWMLLAALTEAWFYVRIQANIAQHPGEPPVPIPSGIWLWAVLFVLIPGGVLMTPVAIVSTISYLFRARALAMAEVQLQLAMIQELLQRPPQKQS